MFSRNYDAFIRLSQLRVSQSEGFFFWGFWEIQKSNMADQDVRHSEIMT